ncbi:MAG: phospholipid carrier-dependent glycosyltransferase [Microcoleaceae cyanobacterium]
MFIIFPGRRFWRKLSGFQLGMIAIFLFSLGLRFWGLGRFNTLVFDEIYYAKFGNNYLTQTPFFNAHPPLAQYLIAIGIWIGSHLPFGQETVNDLTGSTLSTFSYRWFNALIGSLIPLMIGAIAYQLTHRRSYCLIATLLMAVEGLFLVESRYALSSIYIVFFGFLAHLCLIIALNNNRRQRWIFLILSGMNFGAAIAVKWNGLSFLLGAYLLIFIAFIIKRFILSDTADSPIQTPLQKITTLTPIQLLFCLFILPIFVYLLLWIPHLQLNPTPGLWQLHQQILNFHRNLGDGTKIHPYCSKWYSWLLMIRPIAYFFEKVENLQQIDPTLPQANHLSTPFVYAVQGMGNPILWWLSAAALILSIGILSTQTMHYFTLKWQSRRGINLSQNHRIFQLVSTQEWILFYLCLNALINWLPWAIVSRCTFIYHYLNTLGFTILILSWWLEQGLYGSIKLFRAIAISIIFISIIAFLFWLPIYLGLPLSIEEWRLKMWFSSWI